MGRRWGGYRNCEESAAQSPCEPVQVNTTEQLFSRASQKTRTATKGWSLGSVRRSWETQQPSIKLNPLCLLNTAASHLPRGCIQKTTVIFRSKPSPVEPITHGNRSCGVHGASIVRRTPPAAKCHLKSGEDKVHSSEIHYQRPPLKC